ncbi:MAG: exodeoxyribonuclease V subunit gamma [Propionibacteriaceae bacterium]|nr:exodeoxyribonuclease V subunit gamma [Propionibacteriaceae bacterium]
MPQLTVHLAADPVVWADRLAELWARPPQDPFSRDLVCADSPGLRRWLAQRLSTRLGASRGQDGVCAGVDFLPWETWLNRLIELDRPTGDPWRGQSLTEALLQALDQSQDQPWFEPVRRHLAQSPDRPQRRVQLAQRLTGLFEGYRRWRPDLVAAWGQPGPATGQPEPTSADLDPNLGLGLGSGWADPSDPSDPAWWQRGLWRAVVRQLGPPEPGPAWLERLERTGGIGVERVALFCPDQLTGWAGQILRQLAQRHQIDLFTRPAPATGSADDPNLGSPQRAAASLATALSQVRQEVSGALRDLAEVEQRLDDPPLPTTALAAVQAALSGRPGPAAELADWGDGSLAFHSSHGPDRQVEVLRQVLLELLADDPTLEPRHIVVLCPQLEAYRGWIEAALGDDGETDWNHPGHRLRLRLADSWRVRPNPMLNLLLDFLDLAGSRAGLSQLVDLCLSPPVQARFHLTPAQADRLPSLLAEAGVRWGVNATRRQTYGLADFAENTWQAGLNRLVLGVGLSERDLVWHGQVLPLDQVSGDQAGLVGLLLEISGRVRRLLDLCSSPAALERWRQRFDQVWSGLGQVEPGQDWQLQEARALLAGWAQSSDQSPALDLAEVKAVLTDLIQRRGGRDRLLTGDLIVAAPGDLRHVPHRVICWLGLDADRFPRAPRLDGDDLLTALGRPAQAQPTLIDRQIFFDSLLDARQRFVVIYRGRDPRDNRTVNPPAPVRDLLSLAGAWAGPAGAAALVRPHPAQSSRVAGLDGLERTTFDPAPRPPRPARTRLTSTTPEPAPAAAWPLIRLSDLASAVGQPATHFLRQRAGLTPSALTATSSRPAPTADELPLELDPLARWQITDRLLTGLLAGREPESLLAAEWRRGALPPRDLGRRALDRCWAEASAVARQAAPWRRAEAIWQTVDLPLAGGRLTGQVSSRNDVIVAVQASRPQARHQLALWIDLLALRVAQPDRATRAVLVARDGLVELRPPAPAQAQAELERLVELRRMAGLEVLPLPAATAAAWAWFRARGRPVEQDQLRRRWAQEHDRDPAWRLVCPDPDQLWAEPPQPRDQSWAAGPSPQTGSRFEALAEAVYEPLLRAGGRR